MLDQAASLVTGMPKHSEYATTQRYQRRDQHEQKVGLIHLIILK
jgi:hypothetical protein